MRSFYILTAAVLAAGLSAPSWAEDRSRGAAQGYYNDDSGVRGSFPDNLAGQPESRTRAFAPEPRATWTPSVPIWTEREHRYDLSARPSPDFNEGQGPYGPSDR